MAKLENIKLLVLDVDGTLTDAGVYILEDGMQFKKFNARDGIGIMNAMKAGIEVGIISHSQTSTMIETRANMLKMKYYHIGPEPKLDILAKWEKELSLAPSQIAYIGDDTNDLEIMNYVGTSACPSDAISTILENADIQLSKKGGSGCVREFIDTYLLD